MATYLELRARGEKLLAEAEELRVKELGDAIEEIKQKMQAYGLTPEDLGFGGGRSKRKASGNASGKSKAPAKYRGPNGETWSGGRGRKPRWVTEALAAGQKIEQFAV